MKSSYQNPRTSHPHPHPTPHRHTPHQTPPPAPTHSTPNHTNHHPSTTTYTTPHPPQSQPNHTSVTRQPSQTTSTTNTTEHSTNNPHKPSKYPTLPYPSCPKSSTTIKTRATPTPRYPSSQPHPPPPTRQPHSGYQNIPRTPPTHTFTVEAPRHDETTTKRRVAHTTNRNPRQTWQLQPPSTLSRVAANARAKHNILFQPLPKKPSRGRKSESHQPHHRTLHQGRNRLRRLDKVSSKTRLPIRREKRVSPRLRPSCHRSHSPHRE